MTRLVDVEKALRALTLGDGATLDWHGAPRQRQQLVRDLVRRNLKGILERACPHARRLVGTTGFDVVTDRFLATHHLQTRLTREIPGAFTSWLLQQPPSTLPGGADDDDDDEKAQAGACFAELCHFEALEIEVTLVETAAPTARSDPPPDVPLDDALVELDASARLAVYRSPVHLVGAATTRLPSPAPVPFVLLCHQRDEALRVEVIEPAVGKVLVALSSGALIGAAIGRVQKEAADVGVVVDAARVREALLQLHQHGAIASFRSAAPA
jgi:hypothetical protein